MTASLTFSIRQPTFLFILGWPAPAAKITDTCAAPGSPNVTCAGPKPIEELPFHATNVFVIHPAYSSALPGFCGMHALRMPQEGANEKLHEMLTFI
jgi:hypothetical protein